MSDPLEKLLDEGERIVWQGKPRGLWRSAWELIEWRWIFPLFLVIGLLAALTGDSILDVMVAIYFLFAVVIGIWKLQGTLRAWMVTDYILTNKRAIICVGGKGSNPQVAWQHLQRGTPIIRHGKRAGHLYFGHRKSYPSSIWKPEKIGFEDLHDAARVADLIRGVQEGKL